MGCSHKTADDHVVGGDASRTPRTWICSVCERPFQWTNDSSFRGALECPKCGCADMKVVVCGSECLRKVKSRSWRAGAST